MVNGGSNDLMVECNGQMVRVLV